MTISLSIVLWLPLAAGVLALVLPGAAARWTSVLGAVAVLAYAIVLAIDYDTAAGGLQYVTDEVWIRSLGIHYKLAITGLNVFLILLTAITFFTAALWVALKDVDLRKPGVYALLIGLAESGVLGAFMAQDLALFVVFFDLMLVPFYFLIGAWGEYKRVYATTKLCNVMFTYALARRVAGSNVSANCVHPGVIGSNFGHHNSLL